MSQETLKHTPGPLGFTPLRRAQIVNGTGFPQEARFIQTTEDGAERLAAFPDLLAALRAAQAALQTIRKNSVFSGLDDTYSGVHSAGPIDHAEANARAALAKAEGGAR